MARSKLAKQFMIGMCSGVVFYYLLVPSLHEIRGRVRLKKEPDISENTVIPIKEEELSMDPDISDYKDVRVHDLNEDKHQHHDNSSVAESLAKEIGILCVIMAKTNDLDKKSKAIHRTWARRCTDVVYLAYKVTSEYELPVIEIQSPERLIYYREKMKEVMRLIMKTYIDNYEWFLIATDETYVILENLRYFLSDKNFATPTFYGRVNPFKDIRFKKIGLPWQYNIANMGFVMSNEAVRSVARFNYSEVPCNGQVTGDAYSDLCMDAAEVIVGSTKDPDGREMFNCIPPEHLDLIYFPEHEEVGATGQATVSDYAISFCMVNAPKQLGLEYHTYHLRAFGVDKLHVY